jgi:DNA-binding response OmpR family regulator
MLFSETQLPGKSGFELLKFIKNAYPEIKFVTMSANPADETAASELGADAFLGKPFTLQNLFNIVQHFIVGNDTP